MHSFHTLSNTLVACLILMATTTAQAQFKGGVDDGTQVGQTSNQPLGRNIFLGGVGDGVSVGLAANQPAGRNIFVGGIDDGSSVGLATNQPAGRNIFLGGIDDGSSVGLAANQPAGRNIYLGGVDDGTSVGLATNQPAGRNIFPGGASDGWTMALKPAGDTPLPVTLTEFGGHWQQNDARLLWKTASEINSSHFELERSFDGNSFTNIQRIAAAGQSSSARAYDYTDVNVGQRLPAGTSYVYYRLRSVDRDGTATYSGVVVLKANSNGSTASAIEYAVYPNPAHDVVNITASELPAADGTYIRLVDITGRVLLLQKMTVTQQQLSVLGFVDGLYFLQLMAADKVVYSQRILISK